MPPALCRGLANTDPAPGPGGHDLSLDTVSPIKMKPCGYVVRLDVWDRSIVNSLPNEHNWNHMELGSACGPRPESSAQLRIPMGNNNLKQAIGGR
jgi:hypothetical protein